MKYNSFAIIFLLSLVFNFTHGAQRIFKFAMEATYPPFEMVDEHGNIEGFDIDIARLICNDMHVKCEFVNQPFDSLIPNLNIGKFNAIISAMNITKERACVVDFSIPYYANGVSFALPKRNNFSNAQAWFIGKSIGVQQGTLLEQFLRNTYGKISTIKAYASIQSAFLDIEAKRLDAILGDAPIMTQWVKLKGDDEYVTIEYNIIDSTYVINGYGIALKKGNIQDLNQINFAIKKLQNNGEIIKIAKRYFK